MDLFAMGANKSERVNTAALAFAVEETPRGLGANVPSPADQVAGDS
jgi:hypothetical protein